VGLTCLTAGAVLFKVQTALREPPLCCVHGHRNFTGYLGYLSETIMLHRNETAVMAQHS